MESRTNNNPLHIEHGDSSGIKTRLKLNSTDGIISDGELSIGDKVNHKFTFPPPPKENPWSLWWRRVLTIGTALIVIWGLIFLWEALQKANCIECEEQEVEYGVIPDALQGNTQSGGGDNTSTSSSQNLNSSSSSANGSDSRELYVFPVKTLLMIRDEQIRPVADKNHVMIDFKPGGHEYINFIAGIEARESGGSANKPRLGITPIFIAELNKKWGTNYTREDFIGSDKETIRRSLWAAKCFFEDYILPHDHLRNNPHAWLNAWHEGTHEGNINTSSTPYSRAVLNNIDVLEKASKGGKLAVSNSTFFNPLPTQQKYVRGVSMSGDVHHGHDLAAQPGYPIHAVRGGLVIEKDIQINKKTGAGYGKYVVVDDGEFVWLYAHMKKFEVEKNEHITGDHIVGTVGNTGVVDGNFHAHVECWTKEEWAKRQAGKPATPIKRIMWPSHKKNGSLG